MAAKAAGEISEAVQRFADLNGLYADCWTPQDKADLAFLLRQRNIIDACIDGLYAGKYFLQFADGKMQIAARPDMPRSQYENDIFPDVQETPGLGFPVVLWVIIGGVILVGSLWGGSALMKQHANVLTQENAKRTQVFDAMIAKTGNPTTIKAWQGFKQQNAQALKERANEADKADKGGGLFSWIFGKGAGGKIAGSIGIALVVFMGILAFSKFGGKKEGV